MTPTPATSLASRAAAIVRRFSPNTHSGANNGFDVTPGDTAAPVSAAAKKPTAPAQTTKADPMPALPAHGGRSHAFEEHIIRSTSPTGEFPATITPTPANSMRSRVASAPAVKSAIDALRQEQAKFAAVFAEMRCYLDPQGESYSIRRAMAATSDFEQLQKLQARLQQVTGQGAQDLALTARSKCASAFMAVCPKAKEVITAALKELADIEAEIEADEVSLFSKWGVAHAPTPLRRPIAALRSELQNHLDNIGRNERLPLGFHGHMAADFDHLLSDLA